MRSQDDIQVVCTASSTQAEFHQASRSKLILARRSLDERKRNDHEALVLTFQGFRFRDTGVLESV